MKNPGKNNSANESICTGIYQKNIVTSAFRKNVYNVVISMQLFEKQKSQLCMNAQQVLMDIH